MSPGGAVPDKGAHLRRALVWLGALALAVVLPVLATASVASQRARLPPPAEGCADPVAGRWFAHVYYAHVEGWYRFTIDLSATAPGSYEGTVHAHYWYGDDQLEVAPSCSSGVYQKSVQEPATARFQEGRLAIDALSWRSSEPSCGGPATGYLLDHFEGTLDAAGQEFQSVLNADAPEWRDVPTVFRRVACAEAAPELPEPINVAPPPFHPPVVGFGCWGS